MENNSATSPAFRQSYDLVIEIFDVDGFKHGREVLRTICVENANRDEGLVGFWHDRRYFQIAISPYDARDELQGELDL